MSRTDKTLHMLHRIYEAILHEKAPSLAELREMSHAPVTPKDFGKVGADPLRSLIADTPLPLKVDDSKEWPATISFPPASRSS